VDLLSEVAWEPGARSLYFRDPDGHLLELGTPRLWGLDCEATAKARHNRACSRRRNAKRAPRLSAIVGRTTSRVQRELGWKDHIASLKPGFEEN
jgi:hypothetical protein